jgi:hypothetical protein
VTTDRLAELVAQLERVPDPVARSAAQDLVRLLLDLHGEALTHIFELVAASDGDAAATLGSIATDESLRPVLELHDLVRVSTDATSTPVTLLPTRDMSAASAEPEMVTRCELCGGPAGDNHPHVVDVEARAGALSCACRPCFVLLAAPGAGGGRWRVVPDEWRAVGPVDLPEIPVGVAFVVVDSECGAPVAYYPGPAGATQSELDIGIADLPELVPDVEALVVAQGEGYVVPVSAAYALAGELRTTWEGLTGGDAPARALEAFLAQANARTTANGRSA